ncbi:MAG: helix-turn-helix transcriptional regulator, partial [Proteobacteria bacterium]|nr:helix-turn-helix transcriptional regulator [Pseudomonadota bacterium]
MNKPKQLVRLEQIYGGAVKVFTEKGYQRAQTADIAGEVGIAQGTLFNYFQTKDALFDFIIRKEILQLPLEDWPDIPIPAPKPGSTLKFLKVEMKKFALFTTLRQAVALDECANPRQELENIVRELYSTIHDFRILFVMLSRSTLDWPELDDVYNKYVRNPIKRLLKQYLDKRISKKHFRQVPNSLASMRLVTDLVTWSAIQKHSSSDPANI